MESSAMQEKFDKKSSTYVAVGNRNPALSLVRSLRPHQWIKNMLVFAGLIFSRSLGNQHAIKLSIVAFAIFCMASSAIYLLNDLRDLEADRNHPVKRLRPLASGEVGSALAAATMFVLLIGSAVGSVFLRPQFGVVVGAYLVMNVGYSLGLKRLVIIDVMIVAMGFVLRAIAGAVVIGVLASPWLILCTLTLALLVGFGKRRHELTLLNDEAKNHRQSLNGYSVGYLDVMMTIAAGAVVVTYALYTMAEETVARFGSRNLILTLPCVFYGVFRYLYLVHMRVEGGDPTKLFVTDRPTLINVAVWIGIVSLILYGPHGWKLW
jgi:4-hydroxybenzoate polyprenyltransferase